MSGEPLERMMVRAAELRAGADAARRARTADRLRAIGRNPELPVELERRGPSQLSPVAAVLNAIAMQAPPTPAATAGAPSSPVQRLDSLEAQLYKLLADRAPSTWASSRRQLTKIIRAARHELRALEGRPS